MNESKKLVKNTAIIAIGNICTKVVSFFLLPLYTSILTTEEYGVVDLIQVIVVLILGVLTLQFEQGVFRFLIEVRNDKDKQSKFISTTILTMLMCTAAFLCIAYITDIFVNYKYMSYLIANVISTMFLSIMLQIARGIGLNIVYAIGSFFSGGLSIILNVIFLLVLNMRIDGMLLAIILSNLIATVYVVIKIKLLSVVSIKQYDKECQQKLIKYSIPLIPNTLSWWLINASDRFIINIILGVSSNGIYSVAQKFPILLGNISGIFIMAWSESAAENLENKDRDKLYSSIVNKSIYFFSALTLGIISLMPFVFKWFIDDKFIAAYKQIPILMITALFHTVGSLYGSIFTALKLTKSIAKTTIVAGITNVIVTLLLIKWIGLYAASISSLFAFLLVVISRHKIISKFVKIELNIKYVVSQAVIYFMVLFSYYYGHQAFSLFIFICVFAYCIFTNYALLKDSYITILNILKKRIKKST